MPASGREGYDSYRMKIMPDRIHVLCDNFQGSYYQGLWINNKKQKPDIQKWYPAEQRDDEHNYKEPQNSHLQSGI